ALPVQAVARGAPPFGRLEAADHRLDQHVCLGVHLGRRQRAAACEALFQKAPQAAGLGSRDGDPRHHHALQKNLPFVGGEVRLVRHGPTPLLKFLVCFDCGLSAASTAGTAPAVDECGWQSQGVSSVSFARRASIVGFNSSATPGIASTLSNSWLSDGISGFTTPASTFRCSGDNCPSRPSTLSIWAVTSCSFGNAARAEAASVMPVS